MPALDPLAVPEQLPKQLRRDLPRATHALAAASTAVRRYCRWHVAPRVTETVTLDGLGGSVLDLPSLRVHEVTGVRTNGITHLAGTWRVSKRLGLVFTLGGWYWTGAGDVELDIVHGYDLDEVPDVVSIVLTAAARDLASPTGAIREQAGSQSVAPSQVAPNVAGGITLLQHEQAALAPYRIVI